MTDATPVRKRLWAGQQVKPADVGDLARGIGGQIDSQPTMTMVQLANLYTEPMSLGLSKNPVGILCIRVRDRDAQETPLLAGGVCHFVWDGSSAQIKSIDGMSVGSGLTFIFDFLAFFEPAVGA